MTWMQLFDVVPTREKMNKKTQRTEDTRRRQTRRQEQLSRKARKQKLQLFGDML
jgi:hypothetical protein